MDNIFVDPHGNTPLINACGDEDYDMVLALVQDGADVNVANIFGRTPLERAVDCVHKNEIDAVKIVSLLLTNNANINAQNIDGETALMKAAYRRHTPLLRLLIDNGANVNLRRTDGDTILSSIERAAPSTIRMLKKVTRMIEEAGGVR